MISRMISWRPKRKGGIDWVIALTRESVFLICFRGHRKIKNNAVRVSLLLLINTNKSVNSHQVLFLRSSKLN